MPLEDLRGKYEAFGWHVLECDGNNIAAFIDVVNEAKAITERPTLIIAHTVPGKGIKEIEYDYRWHGTPPNKEQATKWLQELRTLKGKIESEHQ